MLYRVFRATEGAGVSDRGGPLHVPRQRQGAGRHDAPGHFGAFYAATSAVAAVAESLQPFRGRDITDEDLVLADGSALSLVAIDDAGLGPTLDLDDPAVLVAEGWRPSNVASRTRSVTQAMARRIYDAGGSGLRWWSTLDADWTNVTLFAERTVDVGLVGVAAVERLDTRHPAVQAAAEHLVIPLVARHARRRR